MATRTTEIEHVGACCDMFTYMLHVLEVLIIFLIFLSGRNPTPVSLTAVPGSERETWN